MNELDPDLQKLIKWSREASPSKINESPFGFAGRVLASRKVIHASTLFQELQQTAWGLRWASLALIICGGLVLAMQSSAPPPTGELSSALSYLASNLPR
jgi:hypothetical protein